MWISFNQTPRSLRINRPWHAEPEHVATPSWTPPVAADASALPEAVAKKQSSIAKPATDESRDLVHRPTEPHPASAVLRRLSRRSCLPKDGASRKRDLRTTDGAKTGLSRAAGR